MIAGCGQPEQNQPEAVVPLRGGAVRGSERWGERFTSGSPLSGAITSGHGSVEGTPVRIARPRDLYTPSVLLCVCVSCARARACVFSLRVPLCADWFECVWTPQQAFNKAMQSELPSPSTGGDPSISGPIHLQPVSARSHDHHGVRSTVVCALACARRLCMCGLHSSRVVTLAQRALDMNTGDARERVALPVEPEPEGYYGGASPGGL